MPRKKPKGRTPSLIGASNGKPCCVEVKKKSKCFRCKNDINAGQECFGIPKLGASFSPLRRCCRSCFEKIIEQTKNDLKEAEDLMISD